MSATGYTSGDPHKVAKSGDTMTGDLSMPDADITTRLRVAGFRTPLLHPTSKYPPRLRAATTSYQMQTGHGWTGGGTGSTFNLNDTTAGNFIKGTQAITGTTAGTGVQSQVRNLSISSTDLTGKMIRLIFKVDNVTHLSKMEFLIGTSTFTNFFRWTFHTHSSVNPNLVTSGDWIIAHLQWADVTAAGGTYSIASNGTPNSKTGFTNMQLNVYDDAAGAVTYHFQAVEIVPDLTNTFASGVVSVTFDDSWQSQWDLARPKMDALGYRGTFYSIQDYIGTAGHMTLAQLKAMDGLGHEIAGHAYYSANHGLTNGFADLTADQVEDDFMKLKLWMLNNGFYSDNYAYPKGHFDATTDGVPVDQIAAKYWRTSRTIVSELKESFPPPTYQRIRAQTAISEASFTPTNVVATGGILDRCQLSGDWLILCLHNIVTTTPADSTELTQTGFNTVMDGINSRSIPVLPVNEVIRLYT